MNFTPISFLGGSKPLECGEFVARSYFLKKTAAIPSGWTAQYMNPLTMTYCTLDILSSVNFRIIVAVPNTVTCIGGDCSNVTLLDGNDVTNYLCPSEMDFCVGQQYEIVVTSGISIVSYFSTASCGFDCRADAGNEWLPGTYYLDAISGSVVAPQGSTITPVGSSYTTSCSGC